MTRTCCRLLRNGIASRLPFDRVLATGYYDGPTEGFTQCAVCQTSYSFRILDWDDEQDWRVLAFAPLKPTFEEIAKKLGVKLEGQPPVVLVPPSGDQHRTVDEIDKMRNPEIRATQFYVTAVEGQIDGASRIWHAVDSRDLETVGDWFDFLGLAD